MLISDKRTVTASETITAFNGIFQPLPPHKWSLGRFGMAINIGALCFLLPVFVFAFFPLSAVVEPMLISDKRTVTASETITAFNGIFQPGFTYDVLVHYHNCLRAP
jgi:hypothetical protein